MSMDNVLLDSFVRILTEVSTPSAVRLVEKSGAADDLWDTVLESGFVDALIPESVGGAGLALAEAFTLIRATGEFLLPVPFAETMIARGLIASSGIEVPTTRPIQLWPTTADGRLRSPISAAPLQGCLALVQRVDRFSLLPMTDRVLDCSEPRVTERAPDSDAAPLASFTAGGVDLLPYAAAINAALMAGAMSRVLTMSLTYVNERQQFGRTLGQFQAIQHQLSLMAEDVATANVAARIGWSGSGLAIDRWRAAIAKCVANESAAAVSMIAHAIHGAIGVTAEYDLQLWTRSLRCWQLGFGSVSYWAQYIADERLRTAGGTTVDFVRNR
jgi:acyl-CoA dehydrogenase